MKKLTLTHLALLALTLTGCDKHPRNRDNVIFYNTSWDILLLNDSTLIFVPDTPGAKNATPIIKHITHDPDCRCREKGGGNDN